MVVLLCASATLGVPLSAGAASLNPVKPVAATYTPAIADTATGSTVRQLAQCGQTMFAVGRFASIKQVKPTPKVLTRNNVFSFSSTTGQLTGWNPDVNGTVNSIAVDPSCATAYLGGSFSSVGGAPAKNIAKVSVRTGIVDTTFAPLGASNRVNTLFLSGRHLLAGGYFTSISGSTKDKYLASLDAGSGADDGYASLAVSGRYAYTQQDGVHNGFNATQVYNFSPSPDRSKLLAMGVFTTVGGLPRRQIVMLDLGSRAGVDPWYSVEFNQNCYYKEPFWLQDASWAPDGSKIYVATTGFKPATDLDAVSGVSTGFLTGEPRGGLCDAAAAFSTATVAAEPAPNHLWVDYTGCDSLYATIADTAAVYFGGHERWFSNPSQCDNNSNHSGVDSPGVGGLLPRDGAVLRSGATGTDGAPQGLYTRSRGAGADDMLLTAQGLWIASDNGSAHSFSQTCGGTSGHAGICMLPR